MVPVPPQPTSRARAQRGVRRTSGFALFLALTACRLDNPAFTKPDVGGGTGVGTGSSASQLESAPGGSDAENSSTGPLDPQPSTQGPQATTSSNQETGTPTTLPGEEAARTFCEGAAICFPVHRLEPGGAIQDLGPSRLRVDFAKPVNLERNWADPPPLDNGIRLGPESAGKISAPLLLPQKREIAFDMWFSPEDVNARNWTLFEIDGLLALERLSTGGLRCSLKSGVVHVGPVATNPSFEPGRLYHVACALSGDRIMMWWSAASVPYALPISSGGETRFLMSLGASTKKEREPFSGRVASLRIWNDVNLMRAKSNLPEPRSRNPVSGL